MGVARAKKPEKLTGIALFVEQRRQRMYQEQLQEQMHYEQCENETGAAADLETEKMVVKDIETEE